MKGRAAWQRPAGAEDGRKVPVTTPAGPVPSPARRRVRLAPALRRQQIIDVATRQIALKGFRGVTVASVAEDAGLSKAGMLRYFPSKADLLLAVMAHRDELSRDFMASLLAGTPGQEAFIAATEEIVRHIADQRELVLLYVVLSAEALDPGHPAHDQFARRYTGARRAFERFLSPSRDDAADLAVQVLAAWDGLQLAWLRDPQLDIAGQWRDICRKILG
jgi:AcrR family transcriptional regulator